jgi:hypothetical protein
MAKRLRGKISSDLDDLDALHEKFPFLPSRETIRPTPNIMEMKWQKCMEIASTWASFKDYTLHRVFGVPFHFRGERFEAVSDIVCGRAVFQQNEFPYATGAEHAVMWYGSAVQERTSDEISHDIETTLRNQLESDAFDFGWYVNPKMTIPEYFHVVSQLHATHPFVLLCCVLRGIHTILAKCYTLSFCLILSSTSSRGFDRSLMPIPAR